MVVLLRAETMSRPAHRSSHMSRRRAGWENLSCALFYYWPWASSNHILKERAVPFPLGHQAHGLKVSDALPPHSPPMTPHNRQRPRDCSSRTQCLPTDLRPVPSGDTGSPAVRGQNVVLSGPSPTLISTAGMSIIHSFPLAQSLGAWLHCPIRPAGSFRQSDSAKRLLADVGPQDSGHNRLGEPIPQHSVWSEALTPRGQGLPRPMSLWQTAVELWAGTANTFARVYNLRVEPISFHVLGNRQVAVRAGRCHTCFAIPLHPGM